MAFKSIEEANNYVEENNKLFFEQIDKTIDLMRTEVSEEEFAKVSEQIDLYKKFIGIHPFYRFTNPNTSFNLYGSIYDILTSNSIRDYEPVKQSLFTAFAPITEKDNLNVILNLQHQENNFENFCFAYKNPHKNIPFSVQPLIDFNNAFDFKIVRQTVLNHQAYSYLKNYQDLKEKLDNHEITSDMFGIELLSSNNEFILEKLTDIENKYLTGSQRTNILDAISNDDASLILKNGISQAKACVATPIQHYVINENAAGTELLKGDIVVFGSLPDNGPSFLGTGSVITDKLELGNGNCLIELTNQNGSCLATPTHFGIGNNNTGVAIARVKTTLAKREEAAKHAKKLSKMSYQNTIYYDSFSPKDGWDLENSLGFTPQVSTYFDKNSNKKSRWNCAAFIANVYHNIGIKIHNSTSKRPEHIWLSELLKNKNVTLISGDLHSEHNENTKKFKISAFVNGTGKPKFSKSGVKYRIVKTWGGYTKEILDSNNADKVIAVKKYNKNFEVTKDLNASEKLNIFQILINKLVKSGENNDLDSQKEILTKLHKNGFNDVTISALYFSTLSICFFKKEFSENAAFIKKIPYSVKDTIAAKNKFDKTNPNVPNPFEEKLQLAALKEDKMEWQEDLKTNILNNTDFNVKLIKDTIKNKASNKTSISDNTITLADVLDAKSTTVENGKQTVQSTSLSLTA